MDYDARNHGQKVVKIEKLIPANFFDFWYYFIHLSLFGIVDITQIYIFAAWNLIQTALDFSSLQNQRLSEGKWSHHQNHQLLANIFIKFNFKTLKHCLAETRAS